MTSVVFSDAEHRDETKARAVNGALVRIKHEVDSLVVGLSASDLQRRSAVTRRSIGGILAHISFSTEKLSLVVRRALKGKRIPVAVATPLGHWLSYRLSEWQADQRPETCAASYDKAHNSLMNLVTSLKNEDWEKITLFPNPFNCTVSVQTTLLTFGPEHTRAHLAEIKQSLGLLTQETYHEILQRLTQTLQKKGSG